MAQKDTNIDISKTTNIVKTVLQDPAMKWTIRGVALLVIGQWIFEEGQKNQISQQKPIDKNIKN